MDEAARVARELATLTARTTHELANVLGIALGFTRFVAEDLADGDRSGAVDQLPSIETALRRAVVLTDTLAAAAEPVLQAQRESAAGPMPAPPVVGPPPAP